MLRWLALCLAALTLGACAPGEPDKSDPVDTGEPGPIETGLPDPGCPAGVFGTSRFGEACFQ